MTHKPFQELRDKIKDHDEIWLEPRPIPPAHQDDRTWCQNNEYEGRKPTRYVRADLLEAAEQEAVELQNALDAMTTSAGEIQDQRQEAEQTIKGISELPRHIGTNSLGQVFSFIDTYELEAALNRSKS